MKYVLRTEDGELITTEDDWQKPWIFDSLEAAELQAEYCNRIIVDVTIEEWEGE